MKIGDRSRRHCPKKRKTQPKTDPQRNIINAITVEKSLITIQQLVPCIHTHPDVITSTFFLSGPTAHASKCAGENLPLPNNKIITREDIIIAPLPTYNDVVCCWILLTATGHRRPLHSPIFIGWLLWKKTLLILFHLKK